MSSIVIAGDTSGTVTLQAPAVAGSTTVNLPSTPGNNGASAVVTTNASGNLGLGVTPSAWGSGQKAFQFGSRGVLSNNASGAYSNFGNNAYFDGTNWRYIASDGASLLQSYNSGFIWNTAPSGTAGNAISFTQAMTLDANGYLGFNGFPAITRNVGGARSQNLVLISTAAGVSGEPTELANICAGSSTATMRIFAGVNVPGGMLELNGGGAPADAGTVIFRSGTGGSASTPPERARISSGGDLLVGATSALGRLHSKYCPALNDNSSAAANQRGTIVAELPSSGTNDNGAFNGLLFISSNSAGVNPPQYIRAYNSGSAATPVFQVLHNGNVQNANNSYGAVSDIKLKENITDATPKLDNLNKLRVVNFNLKEDPDKRKQIGLIAQEVEPVFPGLVEADGEGTKSVKYSVLVPMLLKAVQELNAKVEALTAELNTLKGQA